MKGQLGRFVEFGCNLGSGDRLGTKPYTIMALVLVSFSVFGDGNSTESSKFEPRFFNVRRGNNLLTCADGAAVDLTGTGSLIDCKFINNTAGNDGGAVNIRGRSFVTIRDCQFLSNTARNGGAICSVSSNLDIYDSFISNCIGQEQGAAVFAYSDLSMVRTNISQCRSPRNVVSFGNATLTDLLIEECTSTNGTVLDGQALSSLRLTRGVFKSNQGAAIQATTLTITELVIMGTGSPVIKGNNGNISCLQVSRLSNTSAPTRTCFVAGGVLNVKSSYFDMSGCLADINDGQVDFTNTTFDFCGTFGALRLTASILTSWEGVLILNSSIVTLQRLADVQTQTCAAAAPIPKPTVNQPVPQPVSLPPIPRGQIAPIPLSRSSSPAVVRPLPLPTTAVTPVPIALPPSTTPVPQPVVSLLVTTISNYNWVRPQQYEAVAFSGTLTLQISSEDVDGILELTLFTYTSFIGSFSGIELSDSNPCDQVEIAPDYGVDVMRVVITVTTSACDSSIRQTLHFH